MSKIIRASLFIILILIPIIFYNSLKKRRDGHSSGTPFAPATKKTGQPSVALIFDDLGESLSDLKELYSLKIPLTVSVIPNLKFSKNIAHIASRCGFSVFIHLPMVPREEHKFRTNKYRFLSGSLSRRENESLLRGYLNSIRIAIGVNNHMGSKATEDPTLMRIVVKALKNKGLIFVDSVTSLNSVAYKIANTAGLVCGYNQGFLDVVDDAAEMEKQLAELIDKAREKGKIIVIAHPRKKTINFLKKKIPSLKKKLKFITIKDYFAR